jgi:hypothetical protein
MKHAKRMCRSFSLGSHLSDGQHLYIITHAEILPDEMIVHLFIHSHFFA